MSEARNLFQRGVTEQQAAELTVHRASRHRLTDTVRRSIHIFRAQGLGDVADQFEAILKEDESHFVGSLDTFPDSWAEAVHVLSERRVHNFTSVSNIARKEEK